jgi:hypothetical protein
MIEMQIVREGLKQEADHHRSGLFWGLGRTPRRARPRRKASFAPRR